ncbi:hypothetical protein TNCV_1803761 [Trichonephila clavipes]|nr:hypothetical protein TNCV_1803761 [Trichonephila clavipes]
MEIRDLELRTNRLAVFIRKVHGFSLRRPLNFVLYRIFLRGGSLKENFGRRCALRQDQSKGSNFREIIEFIPQFSVCTERIFSQMEEDRLCLSRDAVSFNDWSFKTYLSWIG